MHVQVYQEKMQALYDEWHRDVFEKIQVGGRCTPGWGGRSRTTTRRAAHRQTWFQLRMAATAAGRPALHVQCSRCCTVDRSRVCALQGRIQAAVDSRSIKELEAELQVVAQALGGVCVRVFFGGGGGGSTRWCAQITHSAQ